MSTKTVLRSSLIAVAALVVTTLGISASDSLQGVSGTLLGQLGGAGSSSECPAGMVATPMLETVRCVDAYEAAPHEVCPQPSIISFSDTETNLTNPDCAVVSAAERQPWVFATREQARLLCMRAGKRLPTAAEWYQVALGTPADSCVTTGTQAQLVGTNQQCVSALGIHDAVGNVWEWVSDDVVDGVLNGRELPSEGYVTQVTADGVPVYTDTQPATAFGNDFFGRRQKGVLVSCVAASMGVGKTLVSTPRTPKPHRPWPPKRSAFVVCCRGENCA